MQPLLSPIPLLSLQKRNKQYLHTHMLEKQASTFPYKLQTLYAVYSNRTQKNYAEFSLNLKNKIQSKHFHLTMPTKLSYSKEIAPSHSLT